MNAQATPQSRWDRWQARARDALARIEQDRSVLAFFWAFVFLSVLYRLGLCLKLQRLATPPFASQGTNLVWLGLKSFAGDVLFAGLLAVVYLPVKQYLRRKLKKNPGETRRGIRAAEHAVADLVLFFFALATFSHLHLIFELESGLTVSLFYVFATQFALGDFVRMISPLDFLAMLAPVGAFHLACLGHARLGRFLKPLLLGAAAVFVVSLIPWTKPAAQELVEPPVAYFARDWLREPLRAYSGRQNEFKLRKDLPGDAQMRSIQLVDPVFVNESASPSVLADWHRPAGAETNRWNIMFFVLESVGSQYVFDASAGNAVPMPFLKRMADGGLYLKHHWSAANTSPQCLFSIFTGQYPKPVNISGFPGFDPKSRRVIFSMQEDVSIPTLNQFLGPDYHTFLVHPSSPTYFFPRHLFINNGVTNIYDLSNLPTGPRADKTALARNEIDSVDYTLKLLDQTPEPFMGIYWSFIPHHPYDDYGEEYRILPHDTNKRNLYYNNLRALDAQLQRMYEQLAKSGRLERTILVFVGDHGEALGQHAGVWGHSFGTFEETYRPPAILYQPKLVPARTIEQHTTHADLVPTLMDLMGRTWDEKVFQGESLLRPSHRKFIFTMDAMSEYITAVDHQWNKVSIAYEKGLTFAYNVERDPDEKLLLETDHLQPHVEAIVKFRNFQDRMMEEYNAAVRAGKPYLGIAPWAEFPTTKPKPGP